MISTEFNQLLKTSIPKSFSATMEERFPGEKVEVKDIGSEIISNGQEVIILTLSGHLFRMFIALIFNKNNSLVQSIQKALNNNSPKLENAEFYDYLNEVGNVLCGSIKRDIQRVIPSLGMSTPSLLSVESFKYIEELKTDHQGGYQVSREQEPLFRVNYYLGAYGEIEFHQVALEEIDSGELEFF